MFKKIPGSLDYSINLNGTIVDHFGNIVEFKKDKNNKIVIDLFNERKKFSTEFLSYLAWYETGCINNLQNHLNDIAFYPYEFRCLRVRCGRIMGFTKPIYLKEGFRYIPNFPRYAINIFGDIIDTFTNLFVTDKSIGTDGYSVAYIYTPDRNANRNIRIHRLIAHAWLPNNDFINKPIINHIDGDRLNNKLENLEWCSFSENSRHALDTGLTKTTKKMKTRDVKTGEINIYKSVSEMGRILGCGTGKNINSFANKLPGYLFNKRYEIKSIDDNTPWFYEDKETLDQEYFKSFYTITVLNKETGELKIFNNVKPFYKAYNLWTKNGSVSDGIALLKERYTNLDAWYKRNALEKPYRVIDIKDKSVIIFGSLKDVQNYIKINKSVLQSDLSRGLKFIYHNKWIVVTGINEIDFDNYKNKPKVFSKVVITNTITGEEIIASSMKHASRIVRINFKTILKYINTDRIIKGYLFRALE